MNAPREPHPLETGPVSYGVYVVLRTIVLATFGEFARALLTYGRPNGRSTLDASPAHENPSNVEKQA